MSAAVLEDGALVLTGWNIRLLVDREGNSGWRPAPMTPTSLPQKRPPS